MTSSAQSKSSGKALELVGNTPIMELTSFDTGKCRLFVKLENQNPGGSIKDRVAVSMIEAAEREGKLKPGGLVVEATSGNTGIGLALIAALKGYKIQLVIPDKMSREKINLLRAMGAQIVLTRSDVGKGHPAYYQDLAEKITKDTPGAFYVDQFNNPANPLAHETSTGPELWQQMEHDLHAVVCGVGSGGTITGLGRFFAKVAPQVNMVLADPAGSILTHYVQTGEVLEESGSWLVEGMGEDFIPGNADLSRVKHAYTITDKESLLTARDLLQKEGILAGSSSGTLVAAALKYCREQKEEQRVVTFICDSGNKYLSKMFNDVWMAEQGFIDHAPYGDLRDLITRRHAEGAIVGVADDDTLLTAYGRMKVYDISQLPVLDGNKIVGILDESDLLLALYNKEGDFRKQVREVMTTRLTTLPPNADFKELLPIFDKGMVAIIEDKNGFVGLITRIDLLNYLRRKFNS